jgi:F0F1-type ATP synthase gamma subunit
MAEPLSPLLGIREEQPLNTSSVSIFAHLHGLCPIHGRRECARLTMQAAEQNILEMEEDLKAEFRETRQNTITAELLDIVSGFEALSPT